MIAWLRCAAVTSRDGMTADWFPFPTDVLAKISNPYHQRGTPA